MLVMRNGALALDAPPHEVLQADVMKTMFGFDAETVAIGGKTWVVPRV
jgi:ABC-type cobalamin/Fe3+-siderophores transport system ATPase subunit